MEETRSNWLAATLMASALLGIPSIYVAAYFSTGMAYNADRAESVIALRTYPSNWHVTFFRPAAAIESAISGCKVKLVCEPSEFGPIGPDTSGR